MIKIGLLGCGLRVRCILQHLFEIDISRQIQIAAVYDPDPLSIEELKKLTEQQFQILSTEDELINHSDINWIWIGSWNYHHAKQVLRCLQAGKNIFCEKPLVTSFEDGLKIYEAWRETKTIFSLGLVLRYAGIYQAIRHILEANILGKTVSFEFNETLPFYHGGYIHGNWRRFEANSGGHMLEKCCHDLDLASWFIKSLPVRVASFGGLSIFKPENTYLIEKIGQSPDGKNPYDQWFDAHHVDPFLSAKDTIDNQVVILEYENGVRATFHTNCHSAIPERRFHICGMEGTLRADLWQGNIEYKRAGFETQTEIIQSKEHTDGHGGGDRIITRNLLQTMLGNEKPLAGIMEGLQFTCVALAIDESMKTGKIVDLRPCWERIKELEGNKKTG
jgi:predicted dehydrogenase